MKFEEVTPPPAPPVTYIISGLTYDEVTTIRCALFDTAMGRGSPNRTTQAQELHGELYEAQNGSQYIGGYRTPAADEF